MITRRAFTAALLAQTATRRRRIGIGTYTYHNYSVEEMIDELQALRIEEIEMSRGEFMNFNHPPEKKFEDFRRRIDAARIRCLSYYAPTIRTMEDLEASIRYARILGSKNITADPTGPILKRIDQRLTAAGMTLGIHNHYFKNRRFDYETPEDILKALSGLSPTIGCTLDIGHIVSCGHDPVEAVKKLGPHLRLVHLKDIQAPGGEVNVLLGQGQCKIPQVLAALDGQNFQGLIALEYEKEGDIRQDIRTQLNYLQAEPQI